MATNLLDLAGYVDKQGELGRQRRNEMLLGGFASQALTGTPDQQEWAAAQAAQISPEAGFKVQEQANAAQDRRQQQLYNMARFIKQSYKAPTAENPAPDNAYVASVYETQFVPGLQRMGLQVSDKFDAARVLPVADQILAMGGGGSDEELKSLRVGANGNYWAIRAGQFIDTGVPAAPDTYVRDQPGVPFDIVNRRTGGSIYDAPSQTQPPGPPAPLTVSSSGPITSVDGTVDTGGPTAIRLTNATPEQNAAVGRAVDALRAAGTSDAQIERYIASEEASFSQAPTVAPTAARPQMRPQSTPLQDAAAARDQRRLELQEEDAGRKRAGASEKPLPVQALTKDLEIEEALGAVDSVSAMIKKHADRLASGELRISPTASIGAQARTAAGISGPNDVNLNELNSDLTRIVNETLRLNKGVQTEGDAQRATQELMQANDQATMSRALLRLAQLNRRAAELQRSKRELIYRNYGREAQPQTPAAPAAGGWSIQKVR